VAACAQVASHLGAARRGLPQGSAPATAKPSTCSYPPIARWPSPPHGQPTATRSGSAKPASAAYSVPKSNLPPSPDPQETARCMPKSSSCHQSRTPLRPWESFVRIGTLGYEDRLKAWRNDEWRFVGIRAKATVKIPYGISHECWIRSELLSPGLWGGGRRGASWFVGYPLRLLTMRSRWLASMMTSAVSSGSSNATFRWD
jgi:hypothetical protein